MSPGRGRAMIASRRRIALLRIIHRRMKMILGMIERGESDRASAEFGEIFKIFRILSSIRNPGPNEIDPVEQNLLFRCSRLNEKITQSFQDSLKKISGEIFRNSVDRSIREFIVNQEDSES